MSSPTIQLISSMATRQLLAELADRWQQRSHERVRIESVGGVDAARRVESGEPFDIAMLASDSIGKLVASGRLVVGSVVRPLHFPAWRSRSVPARPRLTSHRKRP